MKEFNLIFHIWDRDLFASNDFIGSASLDWKKEAYWAFNNEKQIQIRKKETVGIFTKKKSSGQILVNNTKF